MIGDEQAWLQRGDSPGDYPGKGCLLYPNVTFGGVLPAQQLVKNKTTAIVAGGRWRWVVSWARSREGGFGRGDDDHVFR